MDSLKETLKARQILRNGPRYFLMNKIGQINKPLPKVNLGGIDMIERAEIELSLEKLIKGKSNPYVENVIKRKTEYVFNKGEEEYFLIHNKDKYIMQSFSQIVDTNLNQPDLKLLAKRLKLPKGWKFETRILNQELILKTMDGGEAFVIQDEFENTYQKLP